MRLTDFTTLTFDCYGTLIDWETGIIAALAPWRARESIALSDETLLARFGAAETACEAETPDQAYPGILADTLGRMARELGVRARDEDRRSFGASVGDWPAFEDSAAGLAYLRQHYRLVILSNVDRTSFSRSHAKLGVAFDHVFTAQDIGSYKPNLRNFRHALERLGEAGVAPADILHTAQSLFHDHVPAKAMGLATMWINRRRGRSGDGATPPAAATPDWEVASLAEMVALHRAHLATGAA
jgi:2-haloacid dehalogenase